MNWKKFLESVKKENRQNLQLRSSAYGIVWLPGQDDFCNFCMCDETAKIYYSIQSIVA